MKPLTAADALSLSIPERIQLVEDIWDTIAAQGDAVELTPEEKAVVDARLEAYHKDPSAGAPWAEVFERLRSR